VAALKQAIPERTAKTDRPFHDSRVVAALKHDRARERQHHDVAFHDSRVVAALKLEVLDGLVDFRALSTTHESWLR